jgi:hypothetical protein
MTTTIPCPKCKGAGHTGGIVHVARSAGHEWHAGLQCDICRGYGRISIDVARWVADGEKHRKERVAEGISLGERAAALGITAARLSAMENGRADPAMLEKSP